MEGIFICNSLIFGLVKWTWRLEQIAALLQPASTSKGAVMHLRYATEIKKILFFDFLNRCCI